MNLRVKADAFLFDLDGTLYVGDEPVPGAPEVIRALAARLVPLRYVTNTTRMPRRALAERLARMGFPASESEIFTPAVAAARWLTQQAIRLVSLYIPDASREDFAAFDVVPHDGAPDAVVVGDLGHDWTFATLNHAFRQLLAGARLVALHKNRYWFTEGGLSLDAGAFVAALEYAAVTEAIVVGKPSIEFFRQAVESLGVEPSRVAMIGDDLESDVGGAQAAGLLGVLVRTGKFREDQRSSVTPDVVLHSVADIPT